MADDGPGSGWGLRHVRDGVRFGDFLIHLFGCARDRARGLLAAHRARTRRSEGEPGEAFLDDRRYRQAEPSIVDTLGGGRGPSRPDPSPACGHPQARGDFDPTDDLVVVLNPAQAWSDTLEVVLHEFAHALLGHLGPRPSVRQAPLMIATREVSSPHAVAVLAPRGPRPEGGSGGAGGGSGGGGRRGAGVDGGAGIGARRRR